MLVYTAAFDNVAITTAIEFLELTAPSDAAIVILGAELSQSTEAGDAQAEQLRVMFRRYSAAGTGGTALDERPHMVGYPAAGATVTNARTVGTASADLWSNAWNIQAGMIYKPSPEERVYVSPSGIVAFELMAAPADSVSFSGCITWGEIGG